MTRDRFKALIGMLHIVDPATENDKDKLRKLTPCINSFKTKCQSLYQPYQNVAAYERLVKSKHCSGIRQYIANKPVKFGVKLWVLADSKKGYTFDFDIYIGKTGQTYQYGLGCDVVMKLTQLLFNQGYDIFFDNFYTSVKLVNDLFILKTSPCGTVTENHKGFPNSMKNGKIWAKKKDRGEIRWIRENSCLVLQWIDNKVVTMLSTIDKTNDYVEVPRKVKVNNEWKTITVRKPYHIERYNNFMNGVDKSDQILAKYNLLRKCVRWWKTIFFHLIYIATVNSFILFKSFSEQNPDNEQLQRKKKHSFLEFREELIRNLIDLDQYAERPLFRPRPPPQDKSQFQTDHIPVFSDTKRNCKVCYMTIKKEMKVRSYCSAPHCNIYRHYCQGYKCFRIRHGKKFHEK